MVKFDPYANIWAYVFDHNSVIFWAIKLKFHMATQEIIIYRLVARNLDYGPYF